MNARIFFSKSDLSNNSRWSILIVKYAYFVFVRLMRRRLWLSLIRNCPKQKLRGRWGSPMDMVASQSRNSISLTKMKNFARINVKDLHHPNPDRRSGVQVSARRRIARTVDLSFELFCSVLLCRSLWVFIIVSYKFFATVSVMFRY